MLRLTAGLLFLIVALPFPDSDKALKDLGLRRKDDCSLNVVRTQAPSPSGTMIAVQRNSHCGYSSVVGLRRTSFADIEGNDIVILTLFPLNDLISIPYNIVYFKWDGEDILTVYFPLGNAIHLVNNNVDGISIRLKTYPFDSAIQRSLDNLKVGNSIDLKFMEKYMLAPSDRAGNTFPFKETVSISNSEMVYEVAEEKKIRPGACSLVGYMKQSVVKQQSFRFEVVKSSGGLQRERYFFWVFSPDILPKDIRPDPWVGMQIEGDLFVSHIGRQTKIEPQDSVQNTSAYLYEVETVSDATRALSQLTSGEFAINYFFGIPQVNLAVNWSSPVPAADIERFASCLRTVGAKISSGFTGPN